jgi:DNA replication protein DnaC
MRHRKGTLLAVKELPTMPVFKSVSPYKGGFIALDDNQEDTFQLLQKLSEFVLNGGSGTGKTSLMLKLAATLIENHMADHYYLLREGIAVPELSFLLVVRSQPLANELKGIWQSYPAYEYEGQGVTVRIVTYTEIYQEAISKQEIISKEETMEWIQP